MLRTTLLVVLLAASVPGGAQMRVEDLPTGAAPAPVAAPHFPDALHACVWRNWTLVPADRLARALGAPREEVVRIGRAMGLSGPPRISRDQQRRSALTVIRRNWHLLPYEQVLALLDWTPEQMAYSLREDDFLYAKLGSLKPKCPPVKWSPPDERARAREQAIARIVREEFPGGADRPRAALFSFIRDLSRPAAAPDRAAADPLRRPVRYCYSYFALYGDPLLEADLDPYPDGYLARLAETGVTGVWLQGVLYKLAPFPWQPELSDGWQTRVANLRKLVARAKRHGIGVYLYLNEPRAMPLAFYAAHPDLKGAVEGDYAALCSSAPAVQEFLRGAVASICREVPDLGGFFTISASENLSNCWSHYGGATCPRCGKRAAPEVVAECLGLFREGIRQASGRQRLIAWDWGWPEDWVAPLLERLPADVPLQSVSEWDLPTQRGGVATTVGEYSLSAVGPGPRALRHWEIARRLGHPAFAKIQANIAWELSAVPYVPAVANAAQHAINLRRQGVDGVMLGWTLGGYPSPNLQAVAEVLDSPGGADLDTAAVLQRVAEKRLGRALAPAAARLWQAVSAAYQEFPFHIGLVYTGPMQVGPANPLWERPTGYAATMVGFPYDDLTTWRAVYPPEVFIGQFEKVADGFDGAIAAARGAAAGGQGAPWADELRLAEAASIHFRSVANQGRFVQARAALAAARTAAEAGPALDALERVLRGELSLARRLHALQSADARLGFEASNQYYYVPLDLVEKVLNCRDLLDRWLPAERARSRG